MYLHIPASLSVACFPLRVHYRALTVRVSACVAELTGHQSHCGKWKWCLGGETPGGRLGINSWICDALWSTHLRGNRDEGEGKRASGEGTELSRRELFSSPYRAESITDQAAGHLSNAEQLNSEDLTRCQESFQHQHTTTHEYEQS